MRRNGKIYKMTSYFFLVNHTLLDYAEYRITGYNVNKQAFAKSSGTKPGDRADDSLTRFENLQLCLSSKLAQPELEVIRLFSWAVWHMWRMVCQINDRFEAEWPPVPAGIKVICLYLKIPETFMHLIFWDRFWFVCIPFGRMVKF